MLPDIIDKPVGQFLFRETFGSGRIFSHSLLFNVLLAFSFIHISLDRMWQTPRTLFWPFQGLTFERADLTGWFGNLFQTMVSEPAVFVPELIGLIVVVVFGWFLIRRKTLIPFIRFGQIR